MINIVGFSQSFYAFLQFFYVLHSVAADTEKSLALDLFEDLQVCLPRCIFPRYSLRRKFESHEIDQSPLFLIFSI